MITSLDLLHATNLWGKLDAELRARVERVITDPTDLTWDDAYSIILDSTTWITLGGHECGPHVPPHRAALH